MLKEAEQQAKNTRTLQTLHQAQQQSEMTLNKVPPVSDADAYDLPEDIQTMLRKAACMCDLMNSYVCLFMHER